MKLAIALISIVLVFATPAKADIWIRDGETCAIGNHCWYPADNLICASDQPNGHWGLVMLGYDLWLHRSQRKYEMRHLLYGSKPEREGPQIWAWFTTDASGSPNCLVATGPGPGIHADELPDYKAATR